ncbi:acetyl-CoA C-acetyltransferase [soil metagenome]
MTDAVIVAARRTPIGRAFKGSLTQMRPDDLSAVAIAAALADLDGSGGISGADGVGGGALSLMEDLYLGCAEPSAEHGSNMARVVAVLLGQDTLPGATVNRFCASSVQTTRMAFHAIKAGEGSAFISAGVECVSRYADFAGAGGSAAAAHNPLFADAVERTAARAQSNATWTDPREDGLLPDAYIAMGQTAENVATMRGMSRQRQDEWGVLSQNRAEAAIAAGVFDAEITPVTLPDGTIVTADDGPRAGVTYDKVASLSPVFRPDGTITAGNCCSLNDGAAAVIVMSATRAAELDLTPLARIVSTAATALSPEIMGLGPVDASRLALSRAGMSISDMDLYEINEAFAVQVLASADDLGMDPDKLNVHGGAIALGHPFGATGARITTTLLNALKVRDEQFGLETMCVGGGQGMAMVLERL